MTVMLITYMTLKDNKNTACNSKKSFIFAESCFEMTTEEKVNYWVELSDYDLETADAMLQTKRYLYVGFMCHQAKN